MEVWVWVGFITLILALLALDLGVLNRRSHTVSATQALRWTGMFVSIALGFAVAVYFIYENNFLGIGKNVPQPGNKPPIDISGMRAVSEYLQGYMLEYALSLDNIFVIALIFRYFAVPSEHQHRVLFWGIMGALILRGLMIGVGAAAIEHFDWIIWLLGAFLVFTGIKLFFVDDDDKFNPETSVALKLTRRVIRLSPSYDGRHFFTRLADGTRAATPMFVALVVVECTDVVFAVDSIPAIFGITLDPFIVFTSNVFAILGLRSLYFALAAMLDRFRFLKYSLAVVLAFVGVKMLLTMRVPALGINLDVHIHPAISLGIIAVSLGAGVIVSLSIPPRRSSDQDAAPPGGTYEQTVAGQAGAGPATRDDQPRSRPGAG